MASKVIAQLAPSAGSYTGAATVPSGKSWVLSSVVIANRATTADTFRIRVAVADAASDNKQYIAYDVSVQPNSVLPLTLGITMNATDVMYVGSAGGNCSFNIFGDES